MKKDLERYHRRSIRLRGYDYAQAGAYFVTICTRDSECLFGDVVDGEMHPNEFGRLAMDAWSALPDHFPSVILDAFVVMPNHPHGILNIDDRRGGETVGEGGETPRQGGETPALPIARQGGETPPLLGQIVAYYKYDSTRQINLIRGCPGSKVWQRNYYEHIIRNDREWDAIRAYIIANPAQWSVDVDNPVRFSKFPAPEAIEDYVRDARVW